MSYSSFFINFMSKIGNVSKWKLLEKKYIKKKQTQKQKQKQTKKQRAISEDLAFWRSNEGSLRDDD